MSEENNIIIETSDMIIELNDYVSFWGTITGNPESNHALVKYLKCLLSKKQDIFYYVLNTEADKNKIENNKTGNIAYVKETKSLYIFNADQLPPEWILITQDLTKFYTKEETDELLALKANIEDIYSKVEADEKFANIDDLSNHINNNENPHNVNKYQIELDKVENIAPLDLPISNATQQALDLKQDKITGAISEVTEENLPANKIVVTNSEGKLSTDEFIKTDNLEFLDGVTGNIQEQLDNKENAFEKNTAFNKNFTTDLSEIKMNGTASLGVSNNIPKADHVHPSDTTKLDKNPDITAGTGVKITYDQKGLVLGSSNLIESDIPNLSNIYETKSNKVNILTNSTTQYPTTKVVSDALNNKVDKNYLTEKLIEINDVLNTKEEAFEKNTAFNKNFANTSQEIKMNGEANSGTSINVARADHIHPSDTNKENISNKTDSYDTSSPITYASSRALYDGLKTRLKPTNVISGKNMNVTVDGEKVILTAIDNPMTAQELCNLLVSIQGYNNEGTLVLKCINGVIQWVEE